MPTAPPTAGAPAGSLAGLGTGGVEEIVDGAFVLYRRRFLPCFTAMAVVQIPVTAGLTLVLNAALRRVLEAKGDFDLLSQGIAYLLVVVLPSALLSLVATQIGTGAITYLVGKACIGETVGVVEAYRWALRRAAPLIGTAAVVGVACVFGFFLFVVPAVIAFLVSFAAVPVVMLEDRGVLDGIRRSYELATGNLGRVAAVRTIMALFLGACLALGYAAAGTFTDKVETQSLLAQIPTLVAGPVDAISVVLLYFDLRVRREGIDIERMAAALR